MEDVSPGLLEELNNIFSQQVAKSSTIKAYKTKLDNDKLSAQDCARYVHEMVNLAVASVTNTLKQSNLPEGKLYWNIAEAVLVPFLEDVIDQMNDIVTESMKASDKKQNINIKIQGIQYPEGQIQSYLNMIVRNSLKSSEESNE